MTLEEHDKHRLKVYDDAPFEHEPSKHWTDLPSDERDKYLTAHPKTRLMITALIWFGAWAMFALIVWFDPDLSNVSRPKDKVFLMLWTYLGWIPVVYLLVKTYRTK